MLFCTMKFTFFSIISNVVVSLCVVFGISYQARIYYDFDFYNSFDFTLFSIFCFFFWKLSVTISSIFSFLFFLFFRSISLVFYVIVIIFFHLSFSVYYSAKLFKYFSKNTYNNIYFNH